MAQVKGSKQVPETILDIAEFSKFMTQSSNMYTIFVYLFLDIEKQLRYCFVAKVVSIVVIVKPDTSFGPKFHFTKKLV